MNNIALKNKIEYEDDHLLYVHEPIENKNTDILK